MTSESFRIQSVWPGTILLSGAILATGLAAFAQSSEDQGTPLTVIVTGVTHGRGKVDVALYSNKRHWLKPNGATAGKLVPATPGEITFVFENVHPGTYAVSVYHDENDNGDLDTGKFRIPTEGYGFSEASAGVFGPPSFTKASFKVGARPRSITVELEY